MEFLCKIPVTLCGVFFLPRIQPSVLAPELPRMEGEVGLGRWAAPTPTLVPPAGPWCLSPIDSSLGGHVGGHGGDWRHEWGEGAEQITGGLAPLDGGMDAAGTVHPRGGDTCAGRDLHTHGGP